MRTQYLAAAAIMSLLVACERKAEKPAEAPQKVDTAAPAAAPPAPAAAPVTETAAVDPAIARGRTLVEANCSRCHSTDANVPSAHASAPSFALLFTNYPPEYLEEAFAEGVFVGHGDMPAFEFQPNQISDLVVYLKTLGPEG